MGPAVLSSHTNGFSHSVDRNFEEKSNYINGGNSSHESVINNVNGDDCHWYEEIIDENLKWSFALNRCLILLINFRISWFSFFKLHRRFMCINSSRLFSVLQKGTSEFQDIALLDTKRFGKVRIYQVPNSGSVSRFSADSCNFFLNRFEFFFLFVQVIWLRFVSVGIDDRWEDAECWSWRICLSWMFNSSRSVMSFQVRFPFDHYLFSLHLNYFTFHY